MPEKRSEPSPAKATAAAKKAAPPAAATPARGEVTFLTVAEVAAMMRVSKMTVYRMVHAGEMPAVRVGRSFRVPEQAVHDYLRDAFIEAG
jgi:excisionase family DNA binding protein